MREVERDFLLHCNTPSHWCFLPRRERWCVGEHRSAATSRTVRPRASRSTDEPVAAETLQHPARSLVEPRSQTRPNAGDLGPVRSLSSSNVQRSCASAIVTAAARRTQGRPMGTAGLEGRALSLVGGTGVLGGRCWGAATDGVAPGLFCNYSPIKE